MAPRLSAFSTPAIFFITCSLTRTWPNRSPHHNTTSHTCTWVRTTVAMAQGILNAPGAELLAACL
eukprot:1022778-Prorocentrum_minimum.AAC.2